MLLIDLNSTCRVNQWWIQGDDGGCHGAFLSQTTKGKTREGKRGREREVLLKIYGDGFKTKL